MRPLFMALRLPAHMGRLWNSVHMSGAKAGSATNHLAGYLTTSPVKGLDVGTGDYMAAPSVIPH